MLARQREEFVACRPRVETSGLEVDALVDDHRPVRQRTDYRLLPVGEPGRFSRPGQGDWPPGSRPGSKCGQIGVRDEAKLLADYGDCGKPVCCNTHLSEMPPVSMKMAKLQKATLDPTKISGRCGRLKCCLRYEYDTYEQLQKDLPPIGSDVLTGTGRQRDAGRTKILAGQLLVETEDHRRVLIAASDVLTVLKRRSQRIVTVT